MKKLFDEKKTEQVFLLSEYGRQKLLGYADSFKEIAKTLEEEFKWEQGEQSRQSRIYNRKLWENRCMLAENLNEMAGVMAQVAGEVFSYKPFPERLFRQISQALRAEGIIVRDLHYISRRDGRTMISAAMLTEKKGGISVENASDMLSVLMDLRLVPKSRGKPSDDSLS